MNFSLKTKNKIIDVYLPYIILTIIGLCFFIPLLWVIEASFDPNANEQLKLPAYITLKNYVSVITSQDNQRAFGIGLIISVVQTFFVIVCSCLAAYPLSRFAMKHKNAFIYTMLFMTALPVTALMVPVYEEFVTINLYDNILGVILFETAAALPYSIWMMKNFIDSVPVDLEEATWVDGASRLRGITTVIMPLMLPGIFTVAIFVFSGSWGNFFVPYILLSSASKMPASVQLYQFFGQHGFIVYGQLSAYSVLYAIPSIILYIFAQSHMSQGFSMSGATKG